MTRGTDSRRQAGRKKEAVQAAPTSHCGVPQRLWPFKGEVKAKGRKELASPDGSDIEPPLLSRGFILKT